jgi:hypothetical protein
MARVHRSRVNPGLVMKEVSPAALKPGMYFEYGHHGGGGILLAAGVIKGIEEVKYQDGDVYRYEVDYEDAIRGGDSFYSISANEHMYVPSISVDMEPIMKKIIHGGIQLTEAGAGAPMNSWIVKHVAGEVRKHTKPKSRSRSASQGGGRRRNRKTHRRKH